MPGGSVYKAVHLIRKQHIHLTNFHNTIQVHEHYKSLENRKYRRNHRKTDQNMQKQKNNLVPKRVIQRICALVKRIALLLFGFIFISFSTAQSPNLFRSLCNNSKSLSFNIFMYNIQSSAKSLIFYSTFLHILFT
jgi:hypothetical protein